MKKNLFSSVFQCNIHTYVLGCLYILNIGFKLMPAGSACAILKVAHMQKFKAISTACKKALNSGLGPFKDQIAEMVLFWSFFLHKSPFFSLL